LRGTQAYHGPDVSETQAERILGAVLDAGINFIDTADDYGLAEERIGRYLGRRRDEYAVATKCGYQPDGPWHPWGPTRDYRRENLLRNIETSLRRLRRDSVELLQLHNPFPDEVRRWGVVDTLQEIRDKGYAKHLGVSTSADFVPEFLEMECFEVYHLAYSVLDLRNLEAMDLLGRGGYGLILRGLLCKGAPHASSAPRRGASTRSPQEPTSRANLWTLAGLDQLCAECGCGPLEFTLRFALSHPHWQTGLMAMVEPAHLAEDLSYAARGPLPAEVYALARDRVLQTLLQVGPPRRRSHPGARPYSARRRQAQDAWYASIGVSVPDDPRGG
jgi:aryl-alcohol dehydrogenase-like predicted oxidoreductase